MTTKSDRKLIFKQFAATVTKSEGGKTYTFTISTDAVDREGDTIAADGWQLDTYRRNPVVLFAHDHTGLPIGKADSVGVQAGRLVARMHFAPADVYPFADQVRRLVDAGFLGATSVGFLPASDGAAWNKERGGWDYTKQELLEFSIVPVPANPEALIGSSLGDPLRKWAADVLKRHPGKVVVTSDPTPPSERRYLVTPRDVRLIGEMTAAAVRAEIDRRRGRLD